MCSRWNVACRPATHLKYGISFRSAHCPLPVAELKQNYLAEPQKCSSLFPYLSQLSMNAGTARVLFSRRTPQCMSLGQRRGFKTCSLLSASVHAPAAAGVEGDESVLGGTSKVDSVASLSDGAGGTVLETSASDRWATDAMNMITELPPQGDLVSLSLGANTPVGWLQLLIEYIHVHASLPWWGAILASTCLLRIIVFPLVMKAQKNGVIMNNINPEIQKLMKKQKEYRQVGNKAMSDQYSHKIWNIYQKNNCNPLKMAIMPLVQLPLFLSFFIAIRKMAYVPVESMKTGGALWFQDLTVPDPYYVLPVVACASFVASIEVHTFLKY